MLRSSVVGTTRTLTVGTLSADDCDFRDITIAGTAAGGSPTRAGDCGGNSGVTFPAPKTVYWNLAGLAVLGLLRLGLRHLAAPLRSTTFRWLRTLRCLMILGLLGR
jgi:hypothetical protein